MYDNAPPAGVKPLRIIVLALMMGVLLASGTFAFVRSSGGAPSPANPSLTPETCLMILGATALGATMGVLVVPGVIIKQGGHRYRGAATPEEREHVLVQVLGTATVLRCALVEGVGLLGAVFFLLTGEWALLAAPALAALVLLSFFPTDGKVAALRNRLEAPVS
jgi:hypothetical protein